MTLYLDFADDIKIEEIDLSQGHKMTLKANTKVSSLLKSVREAILESSKEKGIQLVDENFGEDNI